MAVRHGVNMRRPLNSKQEERVSELIDQALCKDTPFEIGKKYLIRTVTMVDVGKVRKITKDFIVLTDASWIADTGRFNECLKGPNAFSEIEPFAEDVFVNIESIIDATPWNHTLPKEPK